MKDDEGLKRQASCTAFQ